MKHLSIANIVTATNGTYVGPEQDMDKTVTAVVRDTRDVVKDCLFVPLKGANVDGHSFIIKAAQNGAMLCLSEQDLTEERKEFPENFAYIKVASTFQALKDLAAFYRTQLSCKIVGVVGSVGKTSTKEMIASVLQTTYCVQKTQGNYNNEIGLPLTIFSINEEHEVAVVEMGISDFGEMTRLAKIARPDVVVMTNIGYCHLEQLKDRDGILKAKSEVMDFMKEDGTIILNGDDDKLATIRGQKNRKQLFYGIGKETLQRKEKDVYATEVFSIGIEKEHAVIHMNGEEFEAIIPIPGEHNVYNALAAAAVGATLGLTSSQIKQGVQTAGTISGRNRHFESDGATIIDDCYNANPVSMKASIDVLSNARGRKIAALGDMGELGTEEKALHYDVGKHLAAKSIDILCTVGPLAEEIVRGAKDHDAHTKMYSFENKEELAQFLLAEKESGDTILIKASHFMAFDEVVKVLENGNKQ